MRILSGPVQYALSLSLSLLELGGSVYLLKVYCTGFHSFCFDGGLAGSIKLVSDLAFILPIKLSDIPSATPRTVALGMVTASSLKFASITQAQL